MQIERIYQVFLNLELKKISEFDFFPRDHFFHFVLKPFTIDGFLLSQKNDDSTLRRPPSTFAGGKILHFEFERENSKRICWPSCIFNYFSSCPTCHENNPDNSNLCTISRYCFFVLLLAVFLLLCNLLIYIYVFVLAFNKQWS